MLLHPQLSESYIYLASAVSFQQAVMPTYRSFTSESPHGQLKELAPTCIQVLAH